MSGFDLDHETDTYRYHGEAIDTMVDRIRKAFLETEESVYRAELIRLGWTPPDE